MHSQNEISKRLKVLCKSVEGCLSRTKKILGEISNVSEEATLLTEADKKKEAVDAIEAIEGRKFNQSSLEWAIGIER